MNVFQKDIIALIKAGIDAENIDLSSEFDWEKCLELTTRHNIITIIYYAVMNAQLTVPEDIMNRITNAFFSNVIINERQLYSLEEIKSRFLDKKIDFVLLKGSHLKFLYPKTELRRMGDADILIKMEQYDAIKEILLELGFAELRDEDPEIIWNSKSLHLELHRSLYAKRNADLYDYFGTGWDFAKDFDASNGYVFTKEYEYLYMFTHFAKHFRNGGIGLIHMIDLWIYKRTNQDLDEQFVKKELEKLDMTEFYDNIWHTLNVWFDEQPETEKSNVITEWIFNSGSYGTYEAHVLSKALKKTEADTSNNNAKGKLLKEYLFPPRYTMYNKYTFLRKVPFLLPVMYIWRIVYTVLFSWNKVEKKKNNLKLSSDDNIKNHKEFMENIGIRFSNKGDR